MAKPNWLIIDPTSGSGNGTVDFSTASPHTGRTARTGVATFKAAGVDDIPKTVNQAGKLEFMQMQSSASAGKTGGNVTITGTSNSSKLNFTLGTGTLVITLPTKYTANSVQTDNNVAIAGDPGANAQFSFSITISVPANTTVTSLSKQIICTAAGGQKAICTLTQSAGDPTLQVTPETIELGWEGTAVSAQVISNTDWTVE